ncbi:MAG: hypothetical protein ACC652_07915 [Acidimicrobiales bacterium]
MREKRKAILVTLVASVAVLWPLTHGNDSFPLSTYPMFSSSLGRTTNIELVVGLDAEGNRVALGPQIIAGTDEVIQAGSYVRSEIRNGSANELCAAALGRLGADSDVVSVVVVTDRLDPIAWYAGDKEPQQTQVHATCERAP